MKVLTVVGARPQFVKAAAVSRALADAGHEEVLVHTGQHYDEALSDVFFEELAIPEPSYDLGVGSANHGRQSGWMMASLEVVVEREAPDAVVVYGDTNSTVAGAMVAAKTPATLAHVEAGLRSDVPTQPEEVNRVVTDHVADLLFAPTEAAVRNLEEEGIGRGVHRTGDVMYDALLDARERAREASTALADLDLDAGEYVVATVHRPSNADDADRLATVVDALAAVPQEVVFPAHPRTAERLREFDLHDRAAEELALVDPVGYLDFVRLVDGAARVATDSGGVQKEAFLLATPCVTLREETEWVETVDAGWNVLVGVDADAIRAALTAPFDREPADRPEPYGDGNAADRVVEVLGDACE